MAAQTVAPTRDSDRVEAMDVMRGVALFGILLMNITMFGLPFSYSDPTVYGGAQGADLWSWIILNMGFEGTQRALFSLLFGAGVVLFIARLEEAGRKDALDIFFRRNLWLVAFGVVHAYVLLWVGEILFSYGVTALFVVAFRNVAPKRLMALAAAGFILTTAWSLLDTRHALELAAGNEAALAAEATGESLSEEQEAAKEAWEDFASKLKPGEKKIQEEIDAHKGGYFTVMTHQAPTVHYFESWMLYRYFFDIFSMMLFGMALFKMGVFTLERKMSTYALMMAGGYAVGLSVNFFETKWILDHNFSVIAMSQANITYDLGRLAMTIGHVGALLLFCKSGVIGVLRRALAAVGRMALTNYISHSVICGFVFFGFGFGLYGDLSRHQLYYVVLAIWAFQLVASPLWLARFRYGPLEWGWRALTYGRLPSLRRAAAEAPVAPAF